ncbi:MAG: DUF1223 domain-containing protein [Hyphomonadaceae bacterium]|nr:DUF1223 domain-containing protein [Hyphomonadaceae bacterium]
MTRFFALFALSLSLFGTAMADAERPVLVELFANQNCPACPKAHRTMKQIEAERDDVFILTWTVNYWDYLGEPDPMAMPAAKDRQMAYTDRLSIRAPYTPQSFYDGAKECPGTRKRDIRRNIKTRLDVRDEAAPRLNWDGEVIRVTGKSADTLEIKLVEYLSGDANQTGMVNPVTHVESLGLWMQAEEAFEVSCNGTCAVLLQEQDTGEVIAVKALN